MIRFSIIVVCLNAGKELENTVNSILNQTYKGYEIIVKDGGSKDKSVEKLPANKKLRIFTEEDKGIYDAMNQASKYARGDYLLYLNCGDYFYDEKVLERAAEYMEKSKAHGEYAIFYGNIFNRLTDSLISSNPHIDGFACFRNIPCHQACFYSKALIKNKSYDLNYKVRADYDHFLYSYFVAGVKPKYMPMTVASYQGGGYSETPKGLAISEKEHREICEKYMTLPQRSFYRLLLIVTLQPLRKYMAESKAFSGMYQNVKSKIYGLRGKR